MKELHDLLEAKKEEGVSKLGIFREIGVSKSPIYRALSGESGLQIDTYQKLKQYFKQDFTINGKPVRVNKAHMTVTTIRGTKKTVQKRKNSQYNRKKKPLVIGTEEAAIALLLKMLKTYEKTIIPSYFVGKEDKMVSILEGYDIHIKWYYTDGDSNPDRRDGYVYKNYLYKR